MSEHIYHKIDDSLERQSSESRNDWIGLIDNRLGVLRTFEIWINSNLVTSVWSISI